MNDPKRPDEDGFTHIKRLSPDQFDVVLGTHPSKQKTVRSGSSTGSFGRTAILVVALGIGAYALMSLFHTAKSAEQAVNTPPVQVQPVLVAAEAPPPVQIPQPVAAPLPDYVTPDATTSAPAAAQRTSQSSGFQSMVSPSYLAEYKAALHSDVPQRKVKVDIATASIREWDGRNRYQAQWKIFNNRIENDSVCFNFANASVEHRECRKAAQVFFKEQCREWTRRSDSDRLDQSKATEQRYCGAAGSFNPAG